MDRAERNGPRTKPAPRHRPIVPSGTTRQPRGSRRCRTAAPRSDLGPHAAQAARGARRYCTRETVRPSLQLIVPIAAGTCATNTRIDDAIVSINQKRVVDVAERRASNSRPWNATMTSTLRYLGATFCGQLRRGQAARAARRAAPGLPGVRQRRSTTP